MALSFRRRRSSVAKLKYFLESIEVNSYKLAYAIVIISIYISLNLPTEDTSANARLWTISLSIP